MVQIKYLLLQVIALSLILTGCINIKKKDPEISLNEIHSTVQRKFQEGNWKKAIAQLEDLNSRHLLSPYLQQIQLNLIYAYYKNSDFLKAQSVIDHFIHFNSTHPNIDYVLYMCGMVNMALDYNLLQNFFRIDRSNYNPKYALNALKSFSKLVHDYPKSQYILDAKKHIHDLEERIAKYEYSIAEYYSRRGEWIAVINRIQDMIKAYPNTQATRNGLKLMKNAYHQIRINT